MIKIRYADLRGLHIRTVAGEGHDHLSAARSDRAQRQAALRRARSSARMGQGPRFRSRASGRGHGGPDTDDRPERRRGHARAPGLLVPPVVIIMTAAVAYILLVSVTIRMHEPQASGASGQGTPVPAAVAPPGSRADDPGRASLGPDIADHLGAAATASAQAVRGRPRRDRCLAIAHPVSCRVSAGSEPVTIPVGRAVADPVGGRYRLDGFRLGRARCRRAVPGHRPAGRVPVLLVSAGRRRKSVQDGSAHLRRVWEQA